eukprot:TRINITY_DN34599_c0_g1_i1.p1 TRINITY_DN34599_c0_g1~~TRINITY_DN34599_c0_g1_i1.p1  ORF type:complete len:300 (+),score=41.87 TRINITY_DN34599_c0_g1_i1:52-900(+)
MSFLMKFFGLGKKPEPEPEEEEETPPEEQIALPPTLVGAESLLKEDELLWLNTSISVYPRPRSWRCCYSSKKDGKSFAKLFDCITGKEKTLLIVRDDGGHVFGFWSRDEWEDPAVRDEKLQLEIAKREKELRMGRKYEIPKSRGDINFFGSGHCSLIGIRPEREIYPPSGMNHNYQYLQTNWPEPEQNGLAVGGIPKLFGMHLDRFLDTGVFRGAGGICMTYNSPCLAHKPEFHIRDVEVWSLCENFKGDGPTDESILDAHDTKVDKFILEQAGKKFYADED